MIKQKDTTTSGNSPAYRRQSQKLGLTNSKEQKKTVLPAVTFPIFNLKNGVIINVIYVLWDEQ